MTQIICHRGASAFAPENTLAAFTKAVEMGATFIECDAQMSEDGKIFVFHDAMLRHKTNGQGRIIENHSSILQQLDAGSWFSSRFIGEPLLTLEHALQFALKHNVRLNIELKSSETQGDALAVQTLSEINRIWPIDRVLPLVSSFNDDLLFTCRQLAPEMPLGYLMDRWSETWKAIDSKVCLSSIHCHYRILNKQRVASIKDHVASVYAYTVNQEKLVHKLSHLGVDGVFTDYPDLCH